jgi:hypothetical protein
VGNLMKLKEYFRFSRAWAHFDPLRVTAWPLRQAAWA